MGTDRKHELINLLDRWLNRAALAYKQRNIELSKQALLKSWQYQKELAEMEGSAIPDQPQDPELFFRTWGSRRISEAAEKTFPDFLEFAESAFDWYFSKSDKTQSDWPTDWRRQLRDYLKALSEGSHEKAESEWRKEIQRILESYIREFGKAPPGYFGKQAQQAYEEYLRERDDTEPETET